MTPDDISRRLFLGVGAATAALTASQARADSPPPSQGLAKLIEKLDPYFTPAADFNDVSRGNPIPHTLPADKKKEVGLTRDTWKLEVLSDPDKPATLGKQFTKKDGTALDFAALVELGKTNAVRFAKLMTCLNLGCPLGMGIWEGVPLRDVVWLTKPTANLRRVFYHGYHNDDPKQVFRSSLPVGRVLEDPDDLPPVILCYKLNGEWLSAERGGPVRVLVAEGYGFKSVKWLTTLTLSNLPHANDTYAEQNNDIDSPLKTFAATISVPTMTTADTALPITGYAQVGVSGLSKVQVWLSPNGKAWPADDPYFTKAPWTDATVLPPPKEWGLKLPDDLFGFEKGKPKAWPMKLSKAYWAAELPGVAAGEYTLRCRTIDGKGQAQPMPRPFKKSGRCDIEAVKVVVKG